MRVGIFSGARAEPQDAAAATGCSGRRRWPAPTWPARSPPPSRTSSRPSASERFTVAALDLGIKAMTPTADGRSAASRCTCCRRRRRSTRSRASAPTGCSSPTARATRPPPSTRSTLLRQVLDARIPFFGICFGNQLLGRALGFGTYKLKYGHRGINQPVHGPDDRQGRGDRAQPRLRRRRAARRGRPTTPYGTASRSVHVCLNDDVVEGLELPRRCRRSRCSTTRRRPPVRTTPAYLFDRFCADAHRRSPTPEGARLMPKRDRHLAASWSSAPARSSSARPASSTTPAPRPAGCCARRASGSSWSTPTRPRS